MDCIPLESSTRRQSAALFPLAHWIFRLSYDLLEG